jgi:hypothetical protein
MKCTIRVPLAGFGYAQPPKAPGAPEKLEQGVLAVGTWT